DAALDPFGGNFRFGDPEQGIHDYFELIFVPPIGVRMASRETEAAPVIGPFISPHHRFRPSFFFHDVLVRPSGINVFSIPNLVRRGGNQDWSDSLHVGPETNIEIPLVSIGERFDSACDRM